MNEAAPPSSGPVDPSRARGLGPEEAAAFASSVVPRYLAHFGDRLVAMLAPAGEARVCHVHCRTGYPDAALLERLPSAHVHGTDVSPHALALARSSAASLASAGAAFDYRVAESLPLRFPAGAFSHALSLHPLATPDERRALFEELARLVAPSGQALVALPLRGSFGELADLLRECALKHELAGLAAAVEAATARRPNDDALGRELEAAGFEYVDVDVRTRTLRFDGGRAFFDDPAARLLVLPELRLELGAAAEAPSRAGVDPFSYVRDAVDKYWRGGPFELTVNVGVVSGRRK